MTVIVRGIFLATGIIFNFFGYKVYKIFLFLAGAVVGGFIGFLIGAGIIADSQSGTLYTAIAISVIFAITGGLLSVLIEKLGIFLSGVVLGMTLGFLLLMLGNPDGYSLSQGSAPILAIMGLVGGILALVLHKFVIIISSAAVGSAFIVSSVLNPYHNLEPYIVLWAIVGIIGIAFQYNRMPRSMEPTERSGAVDSSTQEIVRVVEETDTGTGSTKTLTIITLILVLVLFLATFGFVKF